VRGGAIPLAVWSAMLLVLYAANWVWTGKKISAAQTVFAVLVIVAFAAALALLSRQALRRGPPTAEGEQEVSSPEISLGAVGLAVGAAAALFGLAFGHFTIYFGAGLFAASLGRLVFELRAQRRTERAARGRRSGEPEREQERTAAEREGV